MPERCEFQFYRWWGVYEVHCYASGVREAWQLLKQKDPDAYEHLKKEKQEPQVLEVSQCFVWTTAHDEGW